jgi:lipid-A-disaccharide synthase
MKYYIIAGEASGDLHGSNLITEIIKVDSEAEIRGWGGEKMEKAGANIVKHYRNLAFMGFYEVFVNIKSILNNIMFCKEDILKFNPDKIIFIDYPGFNLRIAKWAKSKNNNFKTYYYIAPQIWAWNENRIHEIKKNIDHLYVILPFEKDFFENKHNYKVKYLGHPLLDSVTHLKNDEKEKFIIKNNLNNKKPIIAILPGSRKQEIKKILSVMIDVIDDFKDYQFIIAAAPSINKEFLNNIIKNKNVKIIKNKTYQILSISKAAIVTSGTATLETAILKVPQVVCYKSSFLSYFLAKIFIKIKFISLVNLIMNKEIVKELIQNNCTKDKIIKELINILDLNKRRDLILKYDELISKLGSSGSSKRVANDIILNK